jgi:glycosyltransferase involved in cell wall biosynthesis
MPTIALDGRKYFDFGIGVYIQNLVSEFSSLNPAHQFVLYVSREDRRKVTLPDPWEVRETSHGKYSVGEFVSFGREVRKAGVDLFHEPHFTLPLGLRGRSVVTVHDLIHLKVPQYFSYAQRAYVRFMVRQALRNAGAIIADSGNTKNDLIELFGVAEERVTAIHCGVRPLFRPLKLEAVRRFREERKLTHPYLLFVGNVKPHKNVPTLLRAFSLLHTRFPDLRLVFTGGKCLADRELARLAEDLGILDRITDLGHVEENALLATYSGAEALVLPSFYEGFGLPVLEAMACGVPTVVSTGGSLPEVAGDASLICDPNKPGIFAGAIEKILTDSALRSKLIQLGKQRSSQFSWQETARQTLKVYERVLNAWPAH